MRNGYPSATPFIGDRSTLCVSNRMAQSVLVVPGGVKVGGEQTCRLLSLVVWVVHKTLDAFA